MTAPVSAEDAGLVSANEVDSGNASDASRAAAREEPAEPPPWHRLECVDPGHFALNTRMNVLIWTILSFHTLAQAFMATCLCVILPSIAAELNATVTESLGFGIIFLLTSTIAQPVFKEMSFVVGRRIPFVLGAALFLAGSVLCGLSQSPVALLIGRAVQGLGAGGPVPITALILTDLFDMRRRAKYVSFLNVAWALGTITGPLIGGLVVSQESVGWRWIFWITLPLSTLSLIGGAVMLGYDGGRRQGLTYLYLLKKIDYLGLLLFAVGSSMVVVPLNLGGAVLPWSSPYVACPLSLGFVVLAGLVRHEKQFTARIPFLGQRTIGAEKPVFRPSLFAKASSVMGFVTTTVHGMLMWIVLFYLSIFFMGVKGISPLMTGVWALPGTLAVAPTAVVIGIVVRKKGIYWPFLMGGWALTTVTFVLLLFMGRTSPMVALMFINLLAGLSFGMLVPSLSTAIQASVERTDSGQATCMNLQLRPAGQCLGTAVGLAVFSNSLAVHLKRRGLDSRYAENIMKSMSVGVQHDFKPVEDAIIESAVDALKDVWLAGSIGSIVSVLLTLFIPDKRLPEDRRVGWGANRNDSNLDAAAAEQSRGAEQSERDKNGAGPAVELQLLAPRVYEEVDRSATEGGDVTERGRGRQSHDLGQELQPAVLPRELV